MAQTGLLAAFPRRLKQLRIERGLAARELAAELRVHASAIYNIERGVHAFSLNRLPELGRVLRVDVLDLFTFPEQSLRHTLVDVSRDATIEALRTAHELLRSWPSTRTNR
ncbi:MAG TPA: helix-turn-helix transcriptional regulator [Polyangia bacterium]|nr:helix-turn-helix transcriptional regulator [Polyangia bacterium]